MTKLRMVDERDACIEYAHEVLSAGNSLARKLESVVFEFAEFGTFLPSGSGVTDFRHGGKLPQPDEVSWVHGSGAVAKPVPNQDAELVLFISDYLSSQKYGLCILENFAARSGDSYLKLLGSRLRFLRDEVFHVAVADDTTERIARTLMDAKTSTALVAALSSVGKISPFQSRGPESVIESDLDEIVRRTDHVLLSAYDGEGYLVCTRRVGRRANA